MTRSVLRTGLGSRASSTRPGYEYGQVTRMVIRGTAEYGYLQYALGSDLRPGVTIHSASLEVPQVGGWTSPVAAQRVAKWRFSLLNFNRQPSLTGTPVTATRVGQILKFAVAADVQSVIDAGGATVGWQLSTTDTTKRELNGFKAATTPVLVIEYSYAPAAPTDLKPSGRAVSKSKAWLSWSAGDTSAYRVQIHPDPVINADGSWATTPTFDSGLVDSIAHALDLAASTYGGITAGSTKWHVQVANAAGVESAWSQTVTFPFVAKGTPVFVEPGATVWESSPPIQVTMAGLTRARIFIARADAPSVVLYDSQELPATTVGTLLHTPPVPVLVDDGAQYVITVWAWDDVERESTPGDDPWAVATLLTTLAYDPAVTGVSGVEVFRVGITPFPLLRWDRAVMPDGFTIDRNGKPLPLTEPPGGYAVGVVPADYVDGDAYALRDWTAPPNVPLLYGVRAVVNERTSAPAAEARALMPVRTQWLADPATGVVVPIEGQDEGDWSTPEDAVTHTTTGPDGGLSSTIRGRYGRSGPTGSIAGILRNIRTPGYPSALESEAVLEEWAEGDPGHVYRLVRGHRNIGVYLGEITLKPSQRTSPGDVAILVNAAFWYAG